jgi:two-component system LytT family sensor kinase
MKAVVKRKYTYLLFFIAYVGALIIEKPEYNYGAMTVKECFSYLITVLLHFVLFALMITANSSLLIPYLLDKKRFGLYFLGLGGSVLLYAVLAGHYNGFLHSRIIHDRPIDIAGGFWENLVYALCCSVITSMLYITQKWSEQQEQMKNSQINQLQTELKYLRSQINPHFLFNGLNTVYGSIDMSNRTARDMMVQFSDLLRYNLYEADVDMIELDKEIKYLKNYVALQKARSNENVQVTLDTNYQEGNIKIAPLIFMAFVENAFKYASRGDDINRIIITLNEQNGKIEFNCENTCDEETEPASGGIGLNNAVRRLELLYKDRYQLTIKKENNIYRVELTLQT